MSGSGPRREVAYRVFGAEFNDADYTYAESDEERAPNYLVTPTGARVNRLFVVGVLTEIEEVSDDVLRARVVDPTGAFVIYAGQYQPDALAFFERASPPAFVALTGKARTFQPEGSDRVFTSIRPETVNEVDADTRDRWVVQTAEHTLERVSIFAKALKRPERGQELRSLLQSASVQPGLAAGIPRAIEEYNTTTGYLASIQELAVDSARLVAGEIDAVERDDIEPEEGGEADVDTSFADHLSLSEAEPAEPTPEPADEPEAERDPEDPEVKEAYEGPEVEETPEEPEEEAEEEPEEPEEPPDSRDAEPAAEESADSEEPSDRSRQEEATAGEPQEPSDTTGEEAPVEEGESEETDEMYELSDEERAEVEENYDVGFESGAEIESPESTDGMPEDEAEPTEREGGTEPTEPEEEAESVEDESIEEIAEETADSDGEEAPAEESGAESTDEAELSEAELEDVVIETMEAEADENGITRAELIESVQAEYGVAEAEIEEAIQEALLGGRCFESGDDRLKPI